MSLDTRLLDALSAWRQAPAWRVAFSGGLDSTVLLHLLARLSRQHALPALSAIHVHHGLQAVADAWPEHCRQVCAQLGVPLQVLRVTVAPGASVEQAARQARYAAFATVLGQGEALLTAQHRDDQAETLLFRLLRGAGVRGLAAMPVHRPLGAGTLLRPLLDVSRAELQAYAGRHGVRWVEDPSNRDTGYARNYLRQSVWPVLIRQWPQASLTLARSAAHMAEAQQLLDELAAEDLALAATPAPFPWLPIPSLDLAPLLALSEARQRNALRHWLAPLTRLPDSEHWAGWRCLRDAGVDAAPVWRLAQGELRRAEGRLWWLAGPWLREPSRPVGFFAAGETQLPDNGRVCWTGTLPAGALHLAYRGGGERLDLPGRGRRDLKRLLNESGLPAFVRARVPLLMRGEELLAVGNLPQWRAEAARAGELVWEPPAGDDQGLSC